MITYNELLDVIKSLNPEKTETYKEDFKRQDLYYIDPFLALYPDVDKALDLLNVQYDQYHTMTKPFRRKSDWIQLEYIGVNNEDIYNILKGNLIKHDITVDPNFTDPDTTTSDISEYESEVLFEDFTPAADNIDYKQVLASKNLDRAIPMANKWMRDTEFILMVPPKNEEELEARWDAYNYMIKKHRRVADWKALELFGLTNQQLYDYWKSQIYANEDIPEVDPMDFDDEYENDIIEIPFSESAYLRRYFRDKVVYESGKDIGEALTKLASDIDVEKVYDKTISKKIIEDTITAYQDLNGRNLDVEINYSDMPMFSPDEMIDMGVFGHEPVDNFFDAIGDDIIAGDSTVLEWFNKYKAIYNGFPVNEDFNKINLERVRKLDRIYKLTTVEQRIEDPKLSQSILEMGWNPLYEFSPEMRVKADLRIDSLIESNFGHSQIIDLCGFRTPNLQKMNLNEVSSIPALKPIYIVFEEGKTLFSKAIKKVTNGIYSHAAIAFDSSMNKMYSYGVEHSSGPLGGFVIEDVKEKDKDAHMGIYTIFVPKDIWDTIYKNVMWFVENAKKTTYSFANILTILFQIPYEKSNSLICSQFVDRMLKLGGIDVTGKSSSLVDPNFLRRASRANKNIFKVFEGKVKNFKPQVVYNRVNGLLKKIPKYKISTTIGENTLLETVYWSDNLNALSTIYEHVSNPTLKKIYETFYLPCMEAREIPIRFDKEGDLLLGPFWTDFKAEYAKSHKLLMNYDTKHNYEGMKTELAKLWALSIAIEKKLRSSRFNKSRAKYLTDAKALILNDFNKYLKVVMDHDKNFDFEKYFESTKYYDQVVKVDKNTIKHTINLIKSVV